MEGLLTLLGLALFLGLIVFPIWAIVRISSLGAQNDALASSLDEQKQKLRELERKLADTTPPAASGAKPVAEPPVPPAPAAPLVRTPEPMVTMPPPVEPSPAPAQISEPPAVAQAGGLAEEPPQRGGLKDEASEPPVVEPAVEEQVPETIGQVSEPPFVGQGGDLADAPVPVAQTGGLAEEPPHRGGLQPAAMPEPAASPAESFLRGINWEQFMGAKLFAWLGGLAALLAVGFFVKYSFEHDLVPPAARAAIGFVFAIALVIGGLKIDRARYAVTAQTLIATGIVSLYTVTFACRAVYHFEFFGPVATFLVMVLITAAAFLLAVRLEAQVVAILGILGGFLTPVLVSTGQDNPLGLFGYIALLDLGLVAVALHRRWFYLVPLGAIGTIALQIGWAAKFFEHDPSAQASVAVAVCLVFAVLFLGAAIFAHRRGHDGPELTLSAIVMACVCYGFAGYFLGFRAAGSRVGLVFTFVLLANLCLLTLAWFRRLGALVAIAAAGTAWLLVNWTAEIFWPALASTLMGVCLGFCAFFLATCFVARRFDRGSPAITWSAVALPLVGFAFALYFLRYAEVAGRVGLFFGFVLAAALCLLALAWFERKATLVGTAVAGVGTVLAFWRLAVFTPAHGPTLMFVVLGFSALFLLVYLAARRFGRDDPMITWSAAALPLLALAFAFSFLGYPELAQRPGLLFTFATLADAALLTIAWCDEQMPRLHLVAGGIVFALLGAWTAGCLTAPLLSWALAFYLLHAVLHTAFPLVLERHRPDATSTWWSQLFPPLALVLMLLPLFKLTTISLVFWPCVLLVDLLAIGLALVTASLAAVAAVLVLTLVATGAWLFNLPTTLTAAPALLLVIGGFAVVFFAAGLFLARRLGDRLQASGGGAVPLALFGDARSQIPAFSALLPFVLLIMMTARLNLANPAPIFGLALLLVVMVLGLAVILGLAWLPACALAGVAGLGYSWHARHFAVENATAPLAWYLLFYAVFAVYPFVFRRRFAGVTGPWAIAALAGAAQFPLVYRLVTVAWPTQFPGLLPAAFTVLPLLSLVAILRAPVVNERARLNQLAWFGGVALLFITLIFPIQFERQWLTVSWALEGAALLWLFHRVPHTGLRAVGVVLLCTAFARLALNPAVLSYHARSETAVFNWYLYSYGLVTAALFAGAWLLAPPRERVLGVKAPPLLNTLGTVLAFMLVNIEIADFFSVPGQRVLTFQFSGNFGRDMSYTIAWALFALGLLLMGIWKKARAGRYAALALLGVALLKLFFHDLARLDALYRVGALLAVAVVAILASFAYQRFLPANEKSIPPKS